MRYHMPHILLFALMALLAAPIARSGDRPIVAVFDIQAKRVKIDKALLDGLSDFLGSQLADSGLYQIVPRADMKKRLFAEKKSSYKECYDQSCQVELGRELAAEKIVSTQILKLGKKCKVSVTMFDLAKAATDEAAYESGGCNEDEVVATLEKTVDKVLGRVRSGGLAAVVTTGKEPPKPQVTAPGKVVPPGMVSVARGKYWFGCNPDKDPACRSEAKPGRMVDLTAFFLDRTEVTVRDYMGCVDAGACQKQEVSPLRQLNWGKTEREDHPINAISYSQAEAYCKWAGKRLPTETEWQRAARGADGRTYPWGNDKANCDRAVLSTGGLGCGAWSTAPVCSRGAGVSPTGACDLAGNVMEWVSSAQARGTLMGGSFASDPSAVKVTSVAILKPDSRSSVMGFRCAMDDK